MTITIEFSSFTGVDSSASHVYCRLVKEMPDGSYELIDLKDTLTVEEASVLNKKQIDQFGRCDYFFEAGDTYSGFPSEEKALEAAIRYVDNLDNYTLKLEERLYDKAMKIHDKIKQKA